MIDYVLGLLTFLLVIGYALLVYRTVHVEMVTGIANPLWYKALLLAPLFLIFAGLGAEIIRGLLRLLAGTDRR